MITMLCTSAHAYTHAPLEASRRFDFRVLNWTPDPATGIRAHG